MPQYFLGYDIGTSFVKASLLDAETGITVASASAPDVEMSISSPQKGWAEQEPEMWWSATIEATKRLKHQFAFDPSEVLSIGISYQMHGLVVIDREGKPLRPSIIWCDSRAVETGEKAFGSLGTAFCLKRFMNSPANFTASKLRWVQQNEPAVYEQIHHFMLPGDYIAFKMTGEVSTTVSGLSEGIFWDYQNRFPAYALMDFWGISASLMPNIVPTFGEQGRLTEDIAGVLGLKAGTPLSYRAGDQPNNAFSLNVLNAGEAAATAGTSGVIYGVTERALNDSQSRVNTFVHVNNDLHNDRPSTHETERNGILLCINGTGSLNAWLKRNLKRSYEEMNAMASEVPIGAKGLNMLPFGNGAERVLGNKMLGAQMLGLDFNTHDVRHIARAAQEGIVFALNYGFEVMKEIGLSLHTIRAGHANMFLSPMFRDAFVQTTGATLDLYHTDGAQGAARGAGFGCGFYSSLEEAFVGLTALKHEEPEPMRQTLYQEAYQSWKQVLEKAMRDHDAKDQD